MIVEIEIDGRKLNAVSGSMIIETADSAGIKIPRFCYHKKLSIAANCRMCLVEVEKSPKPLPACATPVTPGMKIFTQSFKAKEAQQSVMEFLLINHPLDCPICDQGGICELQDIALTYGNDHSRYQESKRVISDENLGSLIATNMTRCIQCTRCVRFGQEIAGIRELGTIGRGDRTEISSYLKSHALTSTLSGNIIDLCPVGALTSKPFQFTARSWELKQASSIAPHDGLGSTIDVQTLHGKVMRVVPKENDAINETWLSDRDRFSYAGLYSPNRLSVPMIKQAGVWQETDWVSALDFVSKTLNTISPDNMALIASPHATLEEYYLLQKWFRGLGGYHIDHRLREIDARDDQAFMNLYPCLNIKIAEIPEQQVIIIIGSHIDHEQPLIAQRIYQAFLRGAKIICINPIDFAFAFTCVEKHILAPDKIVSFLSQENILSAYFLPEYSTICVLLGALAFEHPEASSIRYYVQKMVDKYHKQHQKITVGYLPTGSNSAGAWIAGCIPHRRPMGESADLTGYSVAEAIKANLSAYILFNIDPVLDLAFAYHTDTASHPVVNALTQAKTVIAFSAFRTENLLKHADVILPLAMFTENEGTLVNTEGSWQNFRPVSLPVGESRPAWKILRILGGFSYMCLEDISQEIKTDFTHRKILKNTYFRISSQARPKKQWPVIITEWPVYRSDMLVRESLPLQQSPASEPACIRLNKQTALQYQLKVCEQAIAIIQDPRVPDNCIWLSAGFSETAQLWSTLMRMLP